MDALFVAALACVLLSINAVYERMVAPPRCLDFFPTKEERLRFLLRADFSLPLSLQRALLKESKMPLIVKCFTPASLAAAYFSANERKFVHERLDVKAAAWTRVALIGGRVQVLRKKYEHSNWGRIEKELKKEQCDDFEFENRKKIIRKAFYANWMHLDEVGALPVKKFLIDYDATSLYPSAMEKWAIHPNGSRKISEDEKAMGVENFVKKCENNDWLSVLEVKNVVPEKSIVPQRKGPVLQYILSNSDEERYNSVDLKEMIKCGYKLKTGWYLRNLKNYN